MVRPQVPALIAIQNASAASTWTLSMDALAVFSASLVNPGSQSTALFEPEWRTVKCFRFPVQPSQSRHHCQSTSRLALGNRPKTESFAWQPPLARKRWMILHLHNTCYMPHVQSERSVSTLCECTACLHCALGGTIVFWSVTYWVPPW